MKKKKTRLDVLLARLTEIKSDEVAYPSFERIVLSRRVLIRFFENCATHHAQFPNNYIRRGISVIGKKFFHCLNEKISFTFTGTEIDQFGLIDCMIHAVFTGERSLFAGNKPVFIHNLPKTIQASLPKEMLGEKKINDFCDGLAEIIAQLNLHETSPTDSTFFFAHKNYGEQTASA
ncbi:MAG: hypothetical protein HGB03_01615 [Candidatus Yonathbacteria bacterium]|nr:hypothetical protein [Candidatus Yonathbacteria bacterium]NTW47961.1 hypothetical protein [Candidatus Yonathbacteria bacterium]